MWQCAGARLGASFWYRSPPKLLADIFRGLAAAADFVSLATECYHRHMLRDDIVAHKDRMAEIAGRHDLVLVVLYGSVARGTETSASDIDIAIMGKRVLDFTDEAVIGEEMHKAIGGDVSVHSLHHISPLFAHLVMQDGVVLFEDEPERAHAYRMYAWKLAAESKYLRDATYEQTVQNIRAYA